MTPNPRACGSERCQLIQVCRYDTPRTARRLIEPHDTLVRVRSPRLECYVLSRAGIDVLLLRLGVRIRVDPGECTKASHDRATVCRRFNGITNPFAPR